MHYRIPRVVRMIPATAAALCLIAIQVSYADTSPYSHDSNQKTTNLSWMTFMKDSVTLNQLSIPGAHDTMTYGYQPGGLGNLFTGQTIPTDPTPIPTDFVVTQAMNLQTQLNSGLRVFDIRCKDIFNQFLIYHGDFFVGATFDNVLDTVTSFLTAHPGEAVLMRVTNEGPGAPLNIVQDTEAQVWSRADPDLANHSHALSAPASVASGIRSLVGALALSLCRAECAQELGARA